MSVRLRLTRRGATKDPYYRLVAIPKSKARDGRFLEILGTYNPTSEPAEIKVHAERVEYWLDNGAQPSDTARSIVRRMRKGEVIDLDSDDPQQMPGAESSEDVSEELGADESSGEDEQEASAESTEGSEDQQEEETQQASGETQQEAADQDQDEEAEAAEAADADQSEESAEASEHEASEDADQADEDEEKSD